MSPYDQQRRVQNQQQKRAALQAQLHVLLATIEDFLKDSSLSPHEHRFLTSLRAALETLARVFQPLVEKKGDRDKS